MEPIVDQYAVLLCSNPNIHVFFFFHGSFFFQHSGMPYLHFYLSFSVNTLTGVEILVCRLWPSAWQAEGQSSHTKFRNR